MRISSASFRPLADAAWSLVCLFALVFVVTGGCASTDQADPYARSPFLVVSSNAGGGGGGGGNLLALPSQPAASAVSTTTTVPTTTTPTTMATRRDSVANSAVPAPSPSPPTGLTAQSVWSTPLPSRPTVLPAPSATAPGDSFGIFDTRPASAAAPSVSPAATLANPTPANSAPTANANTNAASGSGLRSAASVALVPLSRRPTAREIIVIDPGHGGRDPGAVRGTLYEKEIALDVSLRLARLLRADGFAVKLTRESDTYPTLDERVSFTTRHRGWLFLSIHANSFVKPTSRGVETLYSDRNRWAPASRQLAAAVQRELVAVTPTIDRGVKLDERGIHVLRNARYPAALAELGFMSNDDDLQFLANRDFRETQARALRNGIAHYFNATTR